MVEENRKKNLASKIESRGATNRKKKILSKYKKSTSECIPLCKFCLKSRHNFDEQIQHVVGTQYFCHLCRVNFLHRLPPGVRKRCVNS